MMPSVSDPSSTRRRRVLSVLFRQLITSACLAVVTPMAALAADERAAVNYIPLDPPFVVNFAPDSDVRFLQVTVELTTRNAEVAELIKHNSPAIRNNLVMLFSDQDPALLETREGKDKLRQDALNEAQEVITGEGGPPDIEAVYFTSFVMQ